MAATTMNPSLSKSTFVRGCKCMKSLYLYNFHRELQDELSEKQQTIFHQGNEVGMFARQLFPNGQDATVKPFNYTSSTQITKNLLRLGYKTIYEASFMYNNVYAAADILVIKRDGWYLYEVKSSASVKPYYVLDAALQYYILKNLGYPVKQVGIICINKDYVRHGKIEPEKLFNIHDVTNEVIAKQEYVEDQVAEMQQMLDQRIAPMCKIGPHCNQFFSCDFQGHCWKKFDEAEHPVYNISRIGDRLWDLVKKNIYCQSQIPDSYYFKLSPSQREEITCTLEQSSPEPNIKRLKRFLGEISLPVAFLDFETIGTAIPLFDGTRPFQQVPFQFSLHCDDGRGGYRHHEYLGDGKTDPRPKLIEKLLEAIPATGSVLVYFMPFEKSRLQELGASFPQYRKQLLQLCDRLVDLIIPFRERYVYHYKMNGSASMKSVLPALFPELNYEHLNIQNGSMASQAYLNINCMKDAEQISATRESLLEYCKMDTWGMVELYRYLKTLVNSKVFNSPVYVNF
ncbi:MAG: DUF2779 domain-containing protein [Chitinophagaceae bacterium]|nr:DUF2779 domain-containing protein [Chitinophagaceae bacterium]